MFVPITTVSFTEITIILPFYRMGPHHLCVHSYLLSPVEIEHCLAAASKNTAKTKGQIQLPYITVWGYQQKMLAAFSRQENMRMHEVVHVYLT